LIEHIADAHTATHVIASDGTTELRRTTKLMIALCRTTNILTLDWLVQSARCHQPLDGRPFRIAQQHPTTTAAAEAMYHFSMRTTLRNIARHLERGTLLLQGWSVYVCPKVAGHKAPPVDEFRLIVEATGASWLDSLSPGRREVEATLTTVLLITSDPPTKSQLATKAVKDALQKGAIHRSTTWLFHAIMTQEVDSP
jgi:hypothetical protein